MKKHPIKTLLAVTGMLGAIGCSSVVLAGDAEPSRMRGQVYFKRVCAVCHVQMTGKVIPPKSRKMVEWQAYFKADKHDASGKTIGTVSYYVGQEYRQSIRASNKAAEKYMSVSDPELFADIQAFMISGAEDSYTPISCN
jgi:cytochrome c5